MVCRPPLDLAVVSRGIGLRLLVASVLANYPSEVSGSVAGSVVCDDAVDVADAVGGEPDLCTGEERGGGCALLVGQRLGVGESGESVDDGMQVDVAAFRTGRLRSFSVLGLVAVAAVDPPATTISSCR